MSSAVSCLTFVTVGELLAPVHAGVALAVCGDPTIGHDRLVAGMRQSRPLSLRMPLQTTLRLTPCPPASHTTDINPGSPPGLHFSPAPLVIAPVMAKSNLSLAGLFDNWRSDVKAAVLEFIGTVFFLSLAFGGIQAAEAEMLGSPSPPSILLHDLYISFAIGFSLLVAVWIFYRASGGVFNPNISLALLLHGIIGPLRFVLYCIAQLVGGIAAAAIVLGLTPGPLLSK